MQVDLRDLHVSYRDYDSNDNSPVLHQKDLLVMSDYPLYGKFAKLSRRRLGTARRLGEDSRSTRLAQMPRRSLCGIEGLSSRLAKGCRSVSSEISAISDAGESGDSEKPDMLLNLDEC